MSTSPVAKPRAIALQKKKKPTSLWELTSNPALVSALSGCCCMAETAFIVFDDDKCTWLYCTERYAHKGQRRGGRLCWSAGAGGL
jgi:hypothetical protein